MAYRTFSHDDELNVFEMAFASSLNLEPEFRASRKVSPTSTGAVNLESVHSRKGAGAMQVEVLVTAPASESFTALAVHQEQTPASFYDGKAVLHYKCSGAHLVVARGDLAAAPMFAAMNSEATSGYENNHGANGSMAASNASAGAPVTLSGIDAWITNERVLLFSNPTSAGVAIPYQNISLHATRRLKLPQTTSDSPDVHGLYMQITTVGDESEDEGQIHITLIPTTASDDTIHPPATENGQSQSTDNESAVQALFSAVTTCSNLNPDPQAGPNSDGDGESGVNDTEGVSTIGGLPPAMPGSGGWITSENVDDFVDENGEPRTEAFETGSEEEETTVFRPHEWEVLRPSHEIREHTEGLGTVTAVPSLSGITEERVEGLGAGAGTVRPRTEDEDIDGGENGDADGDAVETKWRCTD